MRLRWAAVLLLVASLALPAASAQNLARGTFTVEPRPGRVEIQEKGMWEVALHIDAAIQCTLPWEPTPDRLSANRTASRSGSFFWFIANHTIDVEFTTVPDGSGYLHLANQTSVVTIESRSTPTFNDTTDVSFIRPGPWTIDIPGQCGAGGYEWNVVAPPLVIAVLRNAAAAEMECDEVFGCFSESAAKPSVTPASSGPFTGTSKVPQDAFAFVALLSLVAVAVMGVLARRARR